MKHEIDGNDGDETDRWHDCPAGCGARYRNGETASLCGFFHR